MRNSHIIEDAVLENDALDTVNRIALIDSLNVFHMINANAQLSNAVCMNWNDADCKALLKVMSSSDWEQHRHL